MRRVPLPGLLLTATLLTACASPDPKQELEVQRVETYWAVDAAVGDRQYIAPVLRFELRNKGREPLRSVQASAAFRQKGEEQKDWGSAWEQLVPAKKSLEPGQRVLVVLKSDGRYYSTGAPESFFQHELFRDARVTLFLRVGSSAWVKFAEEDVERRIGTRSLPSPAP